MVSDDREEFELGWDDEIEEDAKEFTPLDEGDYDFEVVSFERARSSGSGNLPPCNMAVVTLKIENTKREVKDYILLHSSMEWKISSFFVSIGQKKKGERIKMNWGKVLQAKGRCHIIVDSFTKKDGTEGKSNKIGYYLEPIEPEKEFIPGQF